jgi:hypothetical protein
MRLSPKIESIWLALVDTGIKKTLPKDELSGIEPPNVLLNIWAFVESNKKQNSMEINCLKNVYLDYEMAHQS